MTDALTDALKADQPDDYLTVLVGEGKKYRTPADLAKAYINADLHIKELTDELEGERETRATLDEVLTELRKTKPQTPEHMDAPPTVGAVERPGEKDLTKTVEEAVNTVLTTREKEKLAEDNTKSLLTKLVTEYGSEMGAARAVQNFHKDKKHLRDMINTLGFTDPEEAFRLIKNGTPDVDAVMSNTPGANGGQSAHAISPTNPLGLTWGQCKELKKKDPKTYNSAAFRVRMEQAVAKAQASGINFFAT